MDLPRLFSFLPPTASCAGAQVQAQLGQAAARGLQHGAAALRALLGAQERVGVWQVEAPPAQRMAHCALLRQQRTQHSMVAALCTLSQNPSFPSWEAAPHFTAGLASARSNQSEMLGYSACRLMSAGGAGGGGSTSHAGGQLRLERMQHVKQQLLSSRLHGFSGCTAPARCPAQRTQQLGAEDDAGDEGDVSDAELPVCQPPACRAQKILHGAFKRGQQVTCL